MVYVFLLLFSVQYIISPLTNITHFNKTDLKLLNLIHSQTFCLSEKASLLPLQQEASVLDKTFAWDHSPFFSYCLSVCLSV